MKKFLIVSAFSETDLDSGANRLRKLRAGLESNGCQVEWLGPDGGFRLLTWSQKLRLIREMGIKTFSWGNRVPDGYFLFSFPPPWITMLGDLVGLRFPGRLVLDFRDPLLIQQVNPRSSIFRAAVKFVQFLVVSQAKLIILAADGIKAHLPSSRAPTITVLGGIDRTEARGSRVKSRGKKFPDHIVYGGTFYGSRSPLLLLKAIANLQSSLIFDFYVSFTSREQEDEIRAMIEELELKNVYFYPQVRRREFLDILENSGAGLVITHGEGTEYAIPGKIFDYLSSGVVSWVITQDSGLLKFLEEFSVPSIVTNEWSMEAIQEGLKALEKNLRSSMPSVNIEETISRLDSQHQTGLLLESL